MKKPELRSEDGFDGDLAGVLPLLLSAGLLSPADALDRSIELVPHGRSHPVFELRVDGVPRMAVKLFEKSRGGTDGEAGRERAVHALVDALPDLAALLPARIEHLGPDWLLAQQWFDGEAAWVDDALIRGDGDGVEELAELGAQLAPVLARMHRASARLLRAEPTAPPWQGLRATCPWVLRLFDGDAPDDLWRFPSILPLLRKAAARPALVRGLRRARGAWRELALIHGDLKHDNLLRDGAGHYALIDWEMARIGDPAWDLAGLLLRPLLSPHVQGFDDGARRAALALLRSYSHAGEASKPALAQRLVLYCGAWLVMSLLQSESVAANEAQACDKLLATAERCFAQADSWAASLAEDDKEQAHAA